LKFKKNRFLRNERLKTSSEFKRTKRKNHLFFNQGPVKIYLLKQNLEYSRLGITVYKKAGKAFYRNKIKRWAREIFRTNKNDFKEKRDILFVIGYSPELINIKFLEKSFFTALMKSQELEQPSGSDKSEP
jgi:ribonuclease P protein component